MILPIAFTLTTLLSGPLNITQPEPKPSNLYINESFHVSKRTIRRSRLFPGKNLKEASLYQDEHANSLLLYNMDQVPNIDDDLEMELMKEKLTKTLTNLKLDKTGRHKARGRHIRYFKFTGKRLTFYFFISEHRDTVIFGELSCPDQSRSDDVANAVMLSLRPD